MVLLMEGHAVCVQGIILGYTNILSSDVYACVKYLTEKCVSFFIAKYKRAQHIVWCLINETVKS